MHAAHQREIPSGKHQRHQLAFLHAHAVFAGKRASDFHAVPHNLLGSPHSSFEL